MLGDMLADLHTHTTASDGTLSPAELLTAAADAGITTLAITDHDTLAGCSQLPPVTGGVKVIPGIELSARWRTMGIHVVGLNVRSDSAAMQAATEHQRNIRTERAEVIAHRLEAHGYRDTLAGALKLAGEALPGRPHFARYLHESGQISSESRAYKKFLGQGKSCDIRQNWPELEQVNEWIVAADGIPVLAHPAKYKLTNRKLEALVADFTAAGGMAIEVISGQQKPELTERLGRLALRAGLLASCGSDFHRPGQPWAELGRVAPLPAGLTPVWDRW
jgi:predicted metal-dependent phosphoesterase TrpH